MQHELVLILDFGGQYDQLVARRVRENYVYCEIKPHTVSVDEIRAMEPKGIILTGGSGSVREPGMPLYDPAIFDMGIPILGICYGAQLIAHLLGGTVEAGENSEHGKARITLSESSLLFINMDRQTAGWMSHKDQVTALPPDFAVTASSPGCPIAAFEDAERRIYALQFHPEISHTPLGSQMLHNFLYAVCRCRGDWKVSSFLEEHVAAVRDKVGDRKVLCALSGGVDSAVAAALIHRAVGDSLTCIFVDHGLLRKNEGDLVERVFRDEFDVRLIRVDAADRFLDKLTGITDPETKRKIIGEEFIRVFEEESKKIGAVDYLVQGTIYPDVVESGGGGAAVIKSHHNVGGLPDYVDFKEIIEPLRSLFKDEVRALGIQLGLPEDIVWRQPFPGPGLAVRIIGEITREKLAILRDADAIFRDEIKIAGLERKISQYFAVLTDMRSVGVTGDRRTYDYTLALRAVITTDFMTAEWAEIPYEVLRSVSDRIVNEVDHINRVVYDITTKPPATIEWE